MSPVFNAGLYAAASALVVFIVFVRKLSACSLFGLHAYLLPDESSKEEETKSKRKKEKEKLEWDEGKAQVIRITIGDSYLDNTKYFPEYDQAVLYSALAISLLLVREYVQSTKEDFIPVVVTTFCILKLLYILCKVSWDKHSRNWEWGLSCGLGFIGFMLAFVMVTSVSREILDFGLGSQLDKLPLVGPFTVQVLLSLGAGWLTGAFLGPVLKSVRCFWLATNQFGWDPSVVKTSHWNRLLLNVSVVLPLVTALLWVKPMSDLFVRKSDADVRKSDWATNLGFSVETFRELKLVGIFLCGLIQVSLLRINVQTYLNLAVFAWYDSIHGSRAPDMLALRTKILVVNHFMCRVAVQNLVPGVLVLLLVGLSRTTGFVQPIALFLSWWSIFIWTLLTCSVLTLFRFGLLMAY